MKENPVKQADNGHAIQRVLKDRWSPYVFADRPVSDEDLRALFEAARWAASSFNEQPWRYVVAKKSESEAFERLLMCLTESNQKWARHAPVLGISLLRKTLTRGGKPNRVAQHDVGAASASLTVEATARGLNVHQMEGVDVEKAHATVGAPEEFDVVAGIAIGYAGAPGEGDPGLQERDRKPRTRKALGELVFGARFGQAADWL